MWGQVFLGLTSTIIRGHSVLLKDTVQWLRWDWNLQPLDLEPSHHAPQKQKMEFDHTFFFSIALTFAGPKELFEHEFRPGKC